MLAWKTCRLHPWKCKPPLKTLSISNLAIRYSVHDLSKETWKGRKPHFPLQLPHLLGRGSATDIPTPWLTADLGSDNVTIFSVLNTHTLSMRGRFSGWSVDFKPFKFPHVAKSTIWPFFFFQFYLCDKLRSMTPPATLTLTVHQADAAAENLLSQGRNLLRCEYTCQWPKITGRNSDACDAHCHFNYLVLHC